MVRDVTVEKYRHTRIHLPPDGDPCRRGKGRDGTERVSKRRIFQIEVLRDRSLSLGDRRPGKGAGTFSDNESFGIVFVERVGRVTGGNAEDNVDHFAVVEGNGHLRVQEWLRIDNGWSLLLAPSQERMAVQVERPNSVDRLSHVPYQGVVSVLRRRDCWEWLEGEVRDGRSAVKNGSAPGE